MMFDASYSVLSVGDSRRVTNGGYDPTARVCGVEPASSHVPWMNTPQAVQDRRL